MSLGESQAGDLELGWRLGDDGVLAEPPYFRRSTVGMSRLFA
jgi:hypothetical protein